MNSHRDRVALSLTLRHSALSFRTASRRASEPGRAVSRAVGHDGVSSGAVRVPRVAPHVVLADDGRASRQGEDALRAVELNDVTHEPPPGAALDDHSLRAAPPHLVRDRGRGGGRAGV